MRRRTDAFLRGAPRKAPPHEFVLDALAALSPETRPMFGCLAVYVKEKIVFILRDRPDETADNGVWLATAPEHHDSLRREFLHMRSIQLFGTPVTSWQVLPADTGDFEASAMHACDLVLARDPRIGRVPSTRRKVSPKTKKVKPARKAKKTARVRR